MQRNKAFGIGALAVVAVALALVAAGAFSAVGLTNTSSEVGDQSPVTTLGPTDSPSASPAPVLDTVNGAAVSPEPSASPDDETARPSASPDDHDGDDDREDNSGPGSRNSGRGGGDDDDDDNSGRGGGDDD